MTKGSRKCSEKNRLSDALPGAKPPSSQVLDRFAHDRDRAEQSGDHLRAPIGHLAPGKHITHERGGHHQQEDDEAEQPDHFARRLVGAVEKAAEDVEIDDDEEEARAVGMCIAHQPACVDVTHRLFNGAESDQCVGAIMHRHDHAGNDLDHQSEASENTEVPEIVEIARHGITGADRVVDEARKRQPLVDPLHRGMLGRIMLSPGKAHGFLPQPTRMAVSEVKLNFGTSRFLGAGPLRMRAAVS